VTFDSHAVIPAILEKPQLDVEKDLEPVFLVGTAPYVIATNGSRPFKTFATSSRHRKQNRLDPVRLGRHRHPRPSRHDDARQAGGVDIVHVPYRGGGPAMNDVLGGHVDLIAGSAALVTAQLGPNLRPLLQLGRERLPSLKDTQTGIEAGFPDSETLAWWGVFAPTGTPADVTASMAKSIREILSEPAIAAQLRDTQQMSLLLADGKDFGAFFAKQVRPLGKVVRENNIKA